VREQSALCGWCPASLCSISIIKLKDFRDVMRINSVLFSVPGYMSFCDVEVSSVQWYIVLSDVLW